MIDVVAAQIRSRMMSGIKGKNTKPELVLRRLLHAAGLRFRLHQSLPGRPDLVFRKWNAIIFVHGCFWHRHECKIFKWPTTRVDFWRAKIGGNAERDRRNVARLRADGWRVAIVWECALRNDAPNVARLCSRWLKSNTPSLTVE
jgi:DNA mismatch endonuclease (patch repair protein)